MLSPLPCKLLFLTLSPWLHSRGRISSIFFLAVPYSVVWVDLRVLNTDAEAFPGAWGWKHVSPCLRGNWVFPCNVLLEVGVPGLRVCGLSFSFSLEVTFAAVLGQSRSSPPRVSWPLVTSWHLPFCPWLVLCACHLVWRSRA